MKVNFVNFLKGTRKYIIGLAVFLLFVAVIISNNAKEAYAVPDQIVFQSSGINLLYGSSYVDSSSTIQFNKKIDTDGDAAFCVDPSTTFFDVSTCTKSSALGSDMEYIFSYYSDNASNNEHYFITQLATWWYKKCGTSSECYDSGSFTILNNFRIYVDSPASSTYAGDTNSAAAAIATIIKGASSSSGGSSSSSSISVTNDNVTFYETTKNGYYVSRAVGVSLNNIEGSKYTVEFINAPTGTYAGDANGEEKSAFWANDGGFLIYVPVSAVSGDTTISFRLNAQGSSVKTAYKYTCPDVQDVGILTSSSSPVSTTGTAVLSITDEVDTPVTFKKLDNSGNNLSGASMAIYKGACANVTSSTTKFEEWTSSSTPHTHTFTSSEAGTYCYKEVSAPSGYQLSSQSYEFTVSTTGSISGNTTFTITNYPEDVPQPEITETTIKFYKENSAGQNLSRALMAIYKGACANVTDNTEKFEEWSSSGLSPHSYTFTSSEAGTYCYKEVSPPDGYELSNASREFVIGSDGSLVSGSTSLVITNYGEDIPDTPDEITVKVSKTVINGTSELPGAKLEVYSGYCSSRGSTPITSWTSTSVTKSISLPDDARYCLVEKTAPNGYVVAESIEFIIRNGSVESDDASGNKITMKDKPTSIKVAKLGEGGKKLAGAVLRILDSNGQKYGNDITTTTSYTTISNLPYGTYKLVEITPPPGYSLTDATKSFTVNGNTSGLTVTINDDLTEAVISKQDIAGGPELPGALLKILDEDGKLVKLSDSIGMSCNSSDGESLTWVSGDSPCSIYGLVAGVTYKLVEIQAPEGYKQSTEFVEFKVTEDGGVTDKNGNAIDKVVMKNAKTGISISKQDITSKKELPGAKLILKDEDGNVVDEWVSSDSPYIINGLVAGNTYYLTETIAPKGYELSSETVKITVYENGVTNDVVMFNKPIEQPKQSSTGSNQLLLMLILFGSLSLIFYYGKKWEKDEN